jgi:peroxiredoxin Q/BCP
MEMLKVGDKAPEFRVKDDEGKDVALSDFRGKRVVLFFFPKANTSG